MRILRKNCLCVSVPQSCSALCDPMDCSPPSSSIHRTLQARILEWVAIHKIMETTFLKKIRYLDLKTLMIELKNKEFQQ